MKKIGIWFGRQVNGLVPFAYPLLHSFKGGHFFQGIFRYWQELIQYNKLRTSTNEFPAQLSNLYPIYFDRFDDAGELPKHYFYQDIWAATKVRKSGIKRHYDIGSRLDGFIAHCLPFCRVTMIDIRPLDYVVPNLDFIQANASAMPNIRSGSIHSLSCLHAIEHFGLGRYSDPVDPDGHLKALKEFQRIVARGGDIYFATPIGRQRVEFNAHRIFNPLSIVKLFSTCRLVSFGAIDDMNVFHVKAALKDYLHSNYSCGLFHFKKL